MNLTPMGGTDQMLDELQRIKESFGDEFYHALILVDRKERQDKCEICHDGRFIKQVKGHYELQTFDNEDKWVIVAEYCPVCGRKLNATDK